MDYSLLLKLPLALQLTIMKIQRAVDDLTDPEWEFAVFSERCSSLSPDDAVINSPPLIRTKRMRCWTI